MCDAGVEGIACVCEPLKVCVGIFLFAFNTRQFSSVLGFCPTAAFLVAQKTYWPNLQVAF